MVSRNYYSTSQHVFTSTRDRIAVTRNSTHSFVDRVIMMFAMFVCSVVQSSR